MLGTPDRLLDAAWEALGKRDFVRARSLARRACRDLRFRAEADHLLGCVSLGLGDPKGGVILLERARAALPENADVLYDMALCYEQLGDFAKMRERFLQVLELDASAADRKKLPVDEDQLVAIAERALEELPANLLRLLGNVPILVEERPERHLVEEGFDPRALGLFDGPPWSEQGLTGPAQNRIVLYLANIAAVARSQREAEREVKITLLHETAHFFGLEEEELIARGLG